MLGIFFFIFLSLFSFAFLILGSISCLFVCVSVFLRRLLGGGFAAFGMCFLRLLEAQGQCSRWLPLWPVAGGLGGVWAGWPILSQVGWGGVSWQFGTFAPATAPTRCRETRPRAAPAVTAFCRCAARLAYLSARLPLQ